MLIWSRSVKYNNNMKKLVVFFAFALMCMTVSAQSLQETVYLKNGSVINGVIVEEVPGKSLKIKTNDGNVFVYEMSEVERITKTTNADSQGKGGHKGLDFNVNFGYNIATKSSQDGAFVTYLGLGKRFNKNFYAGISTGVNISSGISAIPVYADFKALFPVSSSGIAPFLGLKLGYAFNLEDGERVKVGREWVDLSPDNSFLVEIMPGVQIPLSKSVDFNIGAGYMHAIPSGGGDGAGAIAIKAGFSFHKSGNPRKIVPTRDKGLQLTIEGNGINPWNLETSGGDKDGYAEAGINAVLGYKMTPNISFGLGAGVSYSQTYMTSYNEYEEYNDGNSAINTRIFARGQYRLNDKKLSPFASIDLGWRFRSMENEFNDFNGDEIRTTDFYITPAVGLSLRTTNNSYMEVKLGYEISPKIDGEKREYDGDIYGYDDMKMSGIQLSIGWTHTFKMFSE